MLFNSIGYAIFLPIIFGLYWFTTNHNLKLQNFILLAASYFFYAYWDYRFLFLLVFSTFLDYYTGIKMHESKTAETKKFWFWLSVGINIGFLGLFKYYNFFVSSLAETISLFGLKVNLLTLKIILPVGISFYTFHGLSYVIDIYKNKIKPEKTFIDYALFVSFFPLLIAGPIERATHLLPQIIKPRKFDYPNAVEGLRQILWGLFKKIVIADNCAEYANTIFNNAPQYSGSTHIMGALFFTFQIYCDFSGYSDIAIGTAKLFGIALLKNFAFPYFSRDIAEFWRRWHISLATWFRDYLYIPLGGNQGGNWKKARNIFIIFLVSGFWHGANWTFIVWGLLNAIYFLPLLLSQKNRNHLDTVAQGKFLPSLKELIQMFTTFGLTVFAWIFFRAESMHDAFDYVLKIFSYSLFTLPEIMPLKILLLIMIFMMIEWSGREKIFAISNMGISWPRICRWVAYCCIILAIFCFNGTEQQFIYFQF